jgi:hypothetical protein
MLVSGLALGHGKVQSLPGNIIPWVLTECFWHFETDER